MNMSMTMQQSVAHEPDDAYQLGFWLYLMSDGILFALLFATYGVMARADVTGTDPRSLFDLGHTAMETALLLTSTLTCGLAVAAAHDGRRRDALFGLLVTGLLGAGFLGLEVTEFADMVARGVGPDSSGLASAFFTLVGTHGLHVSVGMVWLVVMAVQLLNPSDRTLSRLTRFGLFWHFLDLVWIGIFSLVYLPGVM